MPLNRLPDFISSNINLTGVSADYLDGVDLTTISSSLRANRAITGGGTITFDASGNLLWSQRFIIISNGRGSNFSTTGYYDIDMPSAGTVITGVGGSANRTVSASGISINVWEALYYILPIGGSQGLLTSNYRIVSYGLDLDIPHNWVLIAVRNGETGYLYLNNGIILELGQSQNGSIQSYLKLGTSNTENFISFRGTTGDEPGTFTHTYIGERIYGGAEQSELVLFKGNDNDLTSGPDRIRSIAAHHVFDTYTSPVSGSFSTVATAGANVTRMIIREGGNVGIGTTTPHTIGTSSTAAMLGIVANATTTVGLVVRGIASQSANLQEWQNNTPTTVASISNAGAITAVDLTLSGNLTVNGTTTNINTTNLVVEDKNIILGDVTTPSDVTGDGGGITLKAAADKTFNWISSTNRWTSNVGLEASSFVRTSGTSSQFLKADGSIDSTTYAPLASPSLTGTPLSTTAAVDTNTTQIATTAYVIGQGYAKLASPTFTGTPLSTTAAVDTNTTQIATTAFVVGQASGANPLALGSVAQGTSLKYSRQDHVHSNTADQFIASNNGNGTNFRVGDDVWLGDIDVANTMSIRGLQSAASGFVRFGSDTNPLGYNGTTFSYGGTFNAAGVTTSGALALNYASPAITSNNASAASIFTSTVTGVTIGSSTIKTTDYPVAPTGTTSGTVTQAAQLSGYIGMPQNAQATSGTFTYSFAASDAGKHIYATGTPTSVTFTIPANSAVAFEIGTTFVVMNDLGAATNISIAITTDTMQLAGTGTTGTRTLARYGVASITKVTSTKWIISGNGLT